MFSRINLSLIPIFCILVISSCVKLTASETEIHEDSVRGQRSFLESVRSREQVYDIDLSPLRCYIQLSDGSEFYFRYERLFIASINDSSQWSFNGIPSKLTPSRDENGEILLPDIRKGINGSWQLDGKETNIRVLPNLTDDEIAELSISHIVYIPERLYVYTMTGECLQVPVITDKFFHVPDYFHSILIEQENKAETIIASSEGDSYSFVFFTDAHWGRNTQHSPALIRHITDCLPIQDVIFGGDVITTHFTNQTDAMELGLDFQSSFDFLGPNFYCLYGNHDNNSDLQLNRPDFHLSDEQIYQWLQSQMKQAHFGEYFNFYYDDPTSKTRVIGLDTGRCYYAVFRNKLHLTFNFALEALTSLPSGWHVIMASHIWCLNNAQSDGSYVQSIAFYLKPILKVFDDFNNRKDGKCTINGQEIPYDFTDATGRIEFCIGGHTHLAYETKTGGGIPIIIVNADGVKQPEKGTINEQSVTITIADYEKRKLHLLVVGRGEDRTIDL